MISSTIKLLSAAVSVAALITTPALATTLHKSKASHHYTHLIPTLMRPKPDDRLRSTVGTGEISVPTPIQTFVSSYSGTRIGAAINSRFC
jgi:hypothetical protein